MPPERRSRTTPDRRAGATPGRTARPGSGGTPRNAARSSQRTPLAGPRAAPSAVTAVAAAAAEEESRLRQRNRLTLEDDKPAAERCLEQLVFGDVEDDEDALLRRLGSSRVREACLLCRRTLRSRARGGWRGPGGGAWGGPVAAGAQVGGTGDRGRRGAPGRSPSPALGCELARAETLSLPAPKGPRHLASSRRSAAGWICRRLSAKPGILGSCTLCWNHGWRFDHLSRFRFVDRATTWSEGVKLAF